MNTETETTRQKRWAIVDDDPMVLEVLAAFLGAITDADLELFENPTEAYEAILDDPLSFEMILTDRTMPKMEGVGLLVLVREAAPHIRMVLVTGNRARLEQELALFDLPFHCVFKPFTSAQLREAVNSAPVISSKIEELDEHMENRREPDTDGANGENQTGSGSGSVLN